MATRSFELIIPHDYFGFLPSTPPLAFISSMANSDPCFISVPMAEKGPESGNSNRRNRLR